MNYLKTFPMAVMCCTGEEWIRRGVFVNPRQKHRKHSGWIFDKVLPLCLLSLSSALFRRKVFEEIGSFDENLPACEDYDFGIRLAQRYPYHFIDRPLIIKRGGHPDQLSHKYDCMDAFRIYALDKALSLDLTPDQRSQVIQEIVIKCRILMNGFKKRKKNEEYEKYARLLTKYTNGLRKNREETT
jgi:GT2 family glycosyltransferase